MNVLIIGLGSIGMRHAKNLYNLNAKIYYYDKSTKIKTKYKKINTLNKSNLKIFDFFIISVPSNLQLKYLEKVIIFNKKVLVEKPVSLDNIKFNNFLKKYKKYDLKKNIFIGYQRFYWSGFKYIQDLLSNKKFGKAKIININFSQNFSFYRPNYSSSYFKQKKTGGGIINDAFSHYLSIVSYLFGKFIEVKCIKTNLILKNVKVEDTAFIIFKTKKIYGSLIGNQFQSGKSDIIEIIFDNGRILTDINKNFVQIYKNENNSKIIKFKEKNWNDIYKNLIKEFIKKDSIPKFNLYDAYNTLLNINKII